MRDSRQPVIPNFFVVGAPRSGTTSIWNYLSGHPDIFMSGVKEPTFFGSDLTKIPNEFFVLERDAYLSLFRGARDKKVRGEASVMYLQSRTAAREIHDFNPDARILIMLRNPVEMLPSYHGVLHWLGHEDMADFEQALALESARRRGEAIPKAAMIREALYYSEVARFGAQVERFLSVFSRDRVKIILFDDFAASPAKHFASVLDFLELPQITLERFPADNAHKEPRSLAFAAFIQRPPVIVRGLLGFLPQTVRFKALVYALLLLNSKSRRRVPIKMETRQRIRELLAPDIKHLGKLIGRDLSGWLIEPRLANQASGGASAVSFSSADSRNAAQ